MPRKTTKIVEATDYAAMMRRMIRAHGRRLATHGDAEDLAELMALRDLMDETIAQTITDARAGAPQWSWAEVGWAAGTTKQGAQQRWGVKDHGVA